MQQDSALGAWAGLGVFTFCPSGDQLHLLVGHVLPMFPVTLVAALTLSHAASVSVRPERTVFVCLPAAIRDVDG
jgi:hypothetical protein